MSTGDSSTWLPAGWTAEVKLVYGRRVECYSNPETGQTFYSQNDVMRYVNMKNACPSKSTLKETIAKTVEVPKSSPSLTSKRKKMLAKKSPMQHEERADEVPKSLPDEVPKSLPDEVPKCLPDDIPKSPPPSTNKRKKMLARKSPIKHEVQTDEASEWLPEGWTEMLKTRNSGVKYKCYIEPVSGTKFYSKPAVTRYLQALKDKSPKSMERKISMDSKSNDCADKTVDCESSAVSKLATQDIETPSAKLCTSQDMETSKGRQCTSRKKNVAAVVMYSPITVETVRVETPDGLPEGWIKELKIQMKGDKIIRKDPFFTDPVSGYIFRSKPDALRFLKSGDIRSCAIKPKRKEGDNLEAINNDIRPQPSDDKQKLADNTPTKKLFTDKEKHVESVSVMENSNLRIPEVEKMENKTPKKESRKRKEIAKAITLPTRSSKRLSGVKAEVDVVLNERSLVAAARKVEASKPFKPETDLEPETENTGSKITAEAPPPADLEHSNQTLKKLPEEKDDMELPGKEQKEEENGEPSFYFESGELFFDPCIEFAVNTLKGNIPIDDNLSVQDYLQLDEDTPNPAQPLQVLPPDPSFVSPGNGNGNDDVGVSRSDDVFKGK